MISLAATRLLLRRELPEETRLRPPDDDVHRVSPAGRDAHVDFVWPRLAQPLGRQWRLLAANGAAVAAQRVIRFAAAATAENVAALEMLFWLHPPR